MVGPPRKKKSLPLFFLENIKKGEPMTSRRKRVA